jgi:hypothetical protein
MGAKETACALLFRPSLLCSQQNPQHSERHQASPEGHGSPCRFINQNGIGTNFNRQYQGFSLSRTKSGLQFRNRCSIPRCLNPDENQAL